MEFADPIKLVLTGTKGESLYSLKYLDPEGLSRSVTAFSNGLHVFQSKFFANHYIAISHLVFPMSPHIKESLDLK